MKKILRFIAFQFLASILLVSPAYAGALLNFVPTPKDIGDGEVRTVTLQISGAKIGGFDLFIDYDPDVVLFQIGASSFGGPFGDQLACPGRPETCTDFGSLDGFADSAVVPGLRRLELSELSLAPETELDSKQFVTFSLAQLAFLGSLPFDTDKSFSLLTVDLGRSTVLDPRGERVPTTAIVGKIVVSTPGPSGLLLIFTGVSVLIALRPRVTCAHAVKA